jgi:hypothetical protein
VLLDDVCLTHGELEVVFDAVPKSSIVIATLSGGCGRGPGGSPAWTT